MNQEILFGKTTKVFNVKKMKELLVKDQREDFTFASAKEYFLTYFAKSIGETRYYYEPQEDYEDGLIQNITDIQMNKMCDHFNETLDYIDHSGKPAKFNLKKWFQREHDETYKINSDPRASQFYTSKKTEQKFLNLSKGFLHKTQKKFESYPEKIKQNVMKVINHITNVWNSGNQECADYCLTWIAHALTGHKMETALFLKSGEGTGKSIIVSFLIQYVIGNSLGLSTARAQQLMKFNSQLLGRILLCLEELPTASKSEWHSISDFLKDLITGKSVDIERKFQDCVQTVNLMSLIILTNNENTIKFGNDARRYFMADISHDKVGDNTYFTDLEKALTKETGEAFFMWLLERYETTKNFDESKVPLTDSKREMKQRNLPVILKYIKENYVCKRLGLIDVNDKNKRIKLNDLKDLVNFEENQKFTTQSFNITLKKDIPIIKVVNYGKNKDLFIEPIDAQTLFQFFDNKGYWSSTYDKFIEDDEVVQMQQDLQEEPISIDLLDTLIKNNLDLTNDKKQLLDENKVQFEEIQKLKQMIIDMQKNTTPSFDKQSLLSQWKMFD